MSTYKYEKNGYSGRGYGRMSYFVYTARTLKYLGTIEGKARDWRIEQSHSGAAHFDGASFRIRNEAADVLAQQAEQGGDR